MKAITEKLWNYFAAVMFILVIGIVVYTGFRFWLFEVWTYHEPPVSEPRCPFGFQDRAECH